MKVGSTCALLDHHTLTPQGKAFVGRRCRVLQPVLADYCGITTTAYRVQFEGTRIVHTVLGHLLKPVSIQLGSWQEIYEICRYQPPANRRSSS